MQRINIFKWKKEVTEQYGIGFVKLNIDNLAEILCCDSSKLGYLWFNIIVRCATIICKDDEVVKMKNFLKTVHL